MSNRAADGERSRLRPSEGPWRVLFTRPTLAEGGADRVTITLLRHLDRARFAPSLVLMRASGPLLAEVPDDVPVHDLGAGSLWTAWRPLARRLREERPDVLFSTCSGMNLPAAVAARRVGGQRLVLSERNGLVRDQPAWKRVLLLACKRVLYRRADVVTAVSEGVRHDLVARLALPPERVRTVYSPLVTPELLAAAAAPLQDPWLADGASPLLLAAGRLVPAKDFATLLRAFARVRDRLPARLLVLGEGPERANLERLADRLGCGGDVRLPGFVANPFPYLAAAAAFVLSSRYEGLPGVLVQAMACGAAVVATDCPFGPGEIVEDGVSGLLVPVGDAAALGAAIERLLTEPGLRAALARQGRQAAGRFTVDRVLPLYAAAARGAAA